MPTTGTVKQIAHRREHDVLGAHDDGRFVAAAQRVGPAVDLEVRLAELHVAIPVRAEQEIRAAEERRDEPRAGPLIQRARLADFLEPAAVHDADSVGHAERFFLVVRHEHRRDSDGALDLADRAPQLLADLRVERAERLVEQQHARLVRQRACERDALLLAARELARQAVVVAFERDELQQLRAPAARGPRGARGARAARTRCCRPPSCGGTARSSGRRSRPRACRAPTFVTSRPCRTMRPWSIVVRPAIARSSVLLPLPEGPSSTNSSPSSICAVTSLTAAAPRKSLDTCSRAIDMGWPRPTSDRVVSGCYRRVGDKVGIKAVTRR